ncbi:hypothetical protein H0H92_002661 [Tricholoma furcatifolium]|nr:hypothetical protein H0H92_002661 [Tricholoma furcatifolium]
MSCHFDRVLLSLSGALALNFAETSGQNLGGLRKEKQKFIRFRLLDENLRILEFEKLAYKVGTSAGMFDLPKD